MTSEVNWALLGVVIERPSYGLELANRFQRVYADVLSLSGDSHVYSALDALVSRGMIELERRGADLERQPKPIYRATELGLRSWEDWLVRHVDAAARRDELWVRQLATFSRDPQAALRVLDRFEREHLKRARPDPARPPRVGADARSELIDGLLSEQRRIAFGGMVSWLRYARAKFETLPAGKQPDESARA